MSNQKYFPLNKEIHAAYKRMIRRCYNPKHDKYKFYGGKGVTVCPQWKENYQTFLDWSIGNGWKSGLELDKDIKGNGMVYAPENCSWITSKENQRARKHIIKAEYLGKEVLIVEFCEKRGLNHRIVIQRMHRDGMTFEQAIKRPTGNGQQHFPRRKQKHLK